MEFVPFPKIYRLRRPVIVTEKIDGTNACIYVPDLDDEPMGFGSRTRWLAHTDDNFGFHRWCAEHAAELRVGLGPGTHFGEWWGQGIQRRYGLQEKRFSLFNVGRWNDENKPACCHVVPVLARLEVFDTAAIEGIVEALGRNGSVAAPGFMQPEGIVAFHEPSYAMFKRTLLKDEEPKGKVSA